METNDVALTSTNIDDAQRLLTERGRDLGFFRMRVAAGRIGVAIGFPQDPMLHLSWPVLAGLAVLAGVLRARRIAHS